MHHWQQKTNLIYGFVFCLSKYADNVIMVILMITFLESCFIVYIAICVLAFILYLPRIRYFFSGFTKQKRFETQEKKNRFAVLVPAKNESAVIAQCLDSLVGQAYDKDFFDIHIIVENKNDETVKIASHYDNTTVHIVDGQRCKGDALAGAFKNIRKGAEKYEAYIIVDADNIADRNFLLEMNNALASGKQIISGKKKIKNWHCKDKSAKSLVCNCSALTNINIEDMGNKFRNKRGLAINFYGTGLLIRADVIDELGDWPFRTLTEDYELKMHAVLKSYSLLYYEHAVVYGEEPTGLRTATRRRLRWVRGYAQCDRLYRKEIIKDTFSGKIKWKNFDVLYALWPIIMFTTASIIMSVVGFAVFIPLFMWGSATWQILFKYVLLPPAIMYALLFLFTLFTLIVGGKEIKLSVSEKAAVLIFNPLYLMQFFPIYIKAFLTHKNLSWESVPRVAAEFAAEEEDEPKTA